MASRSRDISSLPEFVTPHMTPDRAQEIAATFDLRALPADFYANPYPVYEALRAQQPIRRMPDGSYFLTRYAELVAVYRDAQTFSSDKKIEFGPKYNIDSPLFEHHTTSLVFNDPPLHSGVRKLIMGALTRRSIDAMEPALISLVDHLLDGIAAKGRGDLIEDFAAAIPIEVIGNLLGVPHADRAPLRGWSLAILGALEPNLTADQESAGNFAVTQFSGYLRDLIAERRRHPGDVQHDVLTRLIQGEKTDEPLSESELVQNCIFILNAGHETTTNLIGNALVALQDWPEQKHQLLSKIKQQRIDAESLCVDLDLAVDEFLREYSSKTDLKQIDTDDGAYELSAVLDSYAAKYKHSSFSSEKEWRLHSYSDDNSEIKVRVSDDKLIPYIEMDISSDSANFPIRQIGIGPGFKSQESAFAVERLCAQYGIDVEVYFADSPYRSL